jgi:iron complex outermembrane receptor protein
VKASFVNAPLALKNRYTRVLPSMNLRARLTDDFQMRFAYVRIDRAEPRIARAGAGAAGRRIDLVRVVQRDVGPGGIFYKKINGFLASGRIVGTYGGRAYDVNTVVTPDR